jgi:hypothetical protein
MGLPDGADLMITPVSDPTNHYLKINGTSVLGADGTLEGEFYVTAEGQTDASIRGMFTRAYRSEWKKNVERELLQINPKAEVISMDFGENPYNHMDGPIEITIKYRIPDYAFVGSGKMLFVPLVANNVFARAMSHIYLNTSLDERQYGFRDRCSRSVQLNETITVPDGFRMINQPVFINLDGDAASYGGALSQKDNTIEMEQVIVLEKRIYEPSDYPQVKAAVNAQKDMAQTPVILYK